MAPKKTKTSEEQVADGNPTGPASNTRSKEDQTANEDEISDEDEEITTKQMMKLIMKQLRDSERQWRRLEARDQVEALRESQKPKPIRPDLSRATIQFSGTGNITVEDFITQLEEVMTHHHIAEVDAFNTLTTRLTGEAATWWSLTKPTCVDWSDALDAMRLQFGQDTSMSKCWDTIYPYYGSSAMTDYYEFYPKFQSAMLEMAHQPATELLRGFYLNCVPPLIANYLRDHQHLPLLEFVRKGHQKAQDHSHSEARIRNKVSGKTMQPKNGHHAKPKLNTNATTTTVEQTTTKMAMEEEYPHLPPPNPKYTCFKCHNQGYGTKMCPVCNPLSASTEPALGSTFNTAMVAETTTKNTTSAKATTSAPETITTASVETAEALQYYRQESSPTFNAFHANTLQVHEKELESALIPMVQDELPYSEKLALTQDDVLKTNYHKNYGLSLMQQLQTQAMSNSSSEEEKCEPDDILGSRMPKYSKDNDPPTELFKLQQWNIPEHEARKATKKKKRKKNPNTMLS